MEFKVLPIRNKELFLRYAIPCGEVLVRRGELGKELLGSLNAAVANGQEIGIPVEDIFKVASRMCTIIAKRSGKAEIDDEVIRRYFLVEHEKAILWRKSIHPDLSVADCRVYPGKVLRVDGDAALVMTPMGVKRLRTDFEGSLGKGDSVSTHYSYIPERISKAHMQRLMSKFR